MAELSPAPTLSLDVIERDDVITTLSDGRTL